MRSQLIPLAGVPTLCFSIVDRLELIPLSLTSLSIRKMIPLIGRTKVLFCLIQSLGIQSLELLGKRLPLTNLGILAVQPLS